MKPVFKCDYCKFMGTEDQVKEHEVNCIDNYDRKSCHTCVYKQLSSKDGQYLYKCKLEKEIPAGSFFEFCPSYERKEKSEDTLVDLFGGLFGGGF